MKSLHSNREGSALLIVLSFTLLASILGAALLIGTRSQAHVADRQLDMEKALFVAEAGAERAAQYMESQKGYLPNTYTDAGAIGEGNYTYTLTKVGWRAYSLESIGTVGAMSEVIRIARLYLPTYAKYALWMDTNGRIYFIPGEEFFGHVHSNDEVWFSSNSVQGGPTFWEEMTTAANSYGGTIDWVEFHKEFKMNTVEGTMADIDFDSGSAYSLKNLAGTFGLVLEGDTTIKFEGQNMLVTNERKGWNEEVVPIGADQLVYVKDSTTGSSDTQAAKVHVEGGQVDGRMTVVAEDDILIEDHIVYAQDPAVYPDSDDALGLISKDDVWVTQEAPDNLNLSAAMIAAGVKGGNNRGSFGVLDYNEGSPRGALNVNGSIVQDKRGAVGTFNSSGMATGYYKNYTFDARFGAVAPPYYPVVDDSVKYSGWSEEPYL
jgi:hypothetical protein